MLFTLEALQAEQGDCLILHCGDASRPRFFVIDGGPTTVYQQSLKPRLGQLRSKFKQDDGKLDIEMVMVSHIDDDHIRGILDWMDELQRDHEDDNALPYNIQTLWYNSFDNILGNAAEELRSRVASVADLALSEDSRPAARMRPEAAAVIASVAQGRKLRDAAVTLGYQMNGGFEGLVMAGDAGPTVIELGDGLRFTVLTPSKARLEALHKEWEKHVRKHPAAETAAFVDRSVYNLSSISVLAELEGKSILLTGDARGDHLLEGLKTAGRLGSEPMHVDILKAPHHGSDRNVAPEFFERITADHYVISANGLHDNPDQATLRMITEARGGAEYTIHLTNYCMKNNKGKDIGAVIREYLASSHAPGRNVVYRDEAASSIKIDLLGRVAY